MPAERAPVGGPVRPVAVWAEPPGFLLLLGLYGLTHALLRVWVSPTLTIDDSREALFAQTFQWGYQARQPPLYNWLVWAAFRLFGPSVVALGLVKYALVFLTYLFVYLAGRRILADARLAALGAFSLFLIVPINWVIHESLTHSIGALAAAAATCYLLLRLADARTLPGYLGLGLALAAGILSKFSFLLVVGALGLAALTVERYRRVVLHPRVLAALGLVGLLAAPYALWFAEHEFSLRRLYAEEVDPGDPEPYLGGVLSGLYYMGRVTLYYLGLIGIALALVFPEAFRRATGPEAVRPGRRLLARFFLAELGVLLLGALAGGLTYLKFRWLLPAFFLFPLYVLARVDARGARDRAVTRLAAILLAAELLVVVAFVANVYRGDRLGRPSRLTIPYDVVADELRAAGFRRGTIAAGDGAIGGNLRLHFPASRVMRLTNPEYVPPERGGGQCLLVWEKGPADAVPPDLGRWVSASLGVDLTGQEPVARIAARYHHARTRMLEVRYVLFPGGAGRCR